MTQLSQTLAERADSLAQIVSGRSGPRAVQITGKIGLGKTTFLHGLSERLRKQDFSPSTYLLRYHQDTGPAIVVQIADGLTSYGLGTGDCELLRDPTIDLNMKLKAVTNQLERNANEVVLLCDEPREWLVLRQIILTITTRNAEGFASLMP